MAPTPAIDHLAQLREALHAERLQEVDRLLMFEAIAIEVVRVRTIAAARVSLLAIIENVDGRWREIGISWSPDQAVRIIDHTWRARTLPVPSEGRRRRKDDWVIGDKVRALNEKPLARIDGGGFAVPGVTLAGWIEDELRPRGLLAPSNGPGRPRSGVSKYAPGHVLVDLLEIM